MKYFLTNSFLYFSTSGGYHCLQSPMQYGKLTQSPYITFMHIILHIIFIHHILHITFIHIIKGSRAFWIFGKGYAFVPTGGIETNPDPPAQKHDFLLDSNSINVLPSQSVTHSSFWSLLKLLDLSKWLHGFL